MLAKSSMILQDRFVFRKNYIRFSGKTFYMETKPKAIGMKKSSYQYLVFSVLPLDLAHVVASYFGFMDVHEVI